MDLGPEILSDLRFLCEIIRFEWTQNVFSFLPLIDNLAAEF
jgi:hypothetical protein